MSQKKKDGFNEYEISVAPEWEIEYLLAEIEIRRITPRRNKKLSAEKLAIFYECMARGVVANDFRVYRKWGTRELKSMLQAVHGTTEWVRPNPGGNDFLYECMEKGIAAGKETEPDEFTPTGETPCYCEDHEDQFVQNHGTCPHCFYL